MLDIGFVVLNYNIIRETKHCVSSIVSNIDTSNFRIVVVENGSAEGVGKLLESEYRNNRFVNVILNKRNLGFARGNNIGIDYIKEHFGGAKFICCLNNDTLLDQSNMYETLCNIYNTDNSIAVIGPRIFDRYYREYMPKDTKLLSRYQYNIALDELKKRDDEKIRQINSSSKWKKKLLRNNFIYDVNHFRRMLEKRIRLLVSFLSNKKKYYDLIDSLGARNESVQYDVVLHGCCLVFTPAFFKNLSGFDPSTFLYVEEEILYVDVIHAGMHTFKSDDLIIRHLEDVSTDATYSKRAKRKFISENTEDSLRILIRKMESYGMK